jgi:hypothetical protein
MAVFIAFRHSVPLLKLSKFKSKVCESNDSYSFSTPGRVARQGDPGSHEYILLETQVVAQFSPPAKKEEDNSQSLEDFVVTSFESNKLQDAKYLTDKIV